MDKKTKRKKYESPVRFEKTRLNQERVIATFVKLLVERRGGDVNLEEVAERSGVSQRTIFRLFNDKETLDEATVNYTQTFLQAANANVAKGDLPSYVRYLFKKFDDNEDFTLAYLYSRFGIQARGDFRKKFNQIIIAKVLEDKKLTLNKERHLKLAVITSLVNAKIWYDLHNDFDFKGDEIGSAVADAIAVLIENL
jgi:AcrR family transcriptional regulator